MAVGGAVGRGAQKEALRLRRRELAVAISWRSDDRACTTRQRGARDAGFFFLRVPRAGHHCARCRHVPFLPSPFQARRRARLLSPNFFSQSLPTDLKKCVVPWTPSPKFHFLCLFFDAFFCVRPCRACRASRLSKYVPHSGTLLFFRYRKKKMARLAFRCDAHLSRPAAVKSRASPFSFSISTTAHPEPPAKPHAPRPMSLFFQFPTPKNSENTT